jgi:ribonuclease-3
VFTHPSWAEERAESYERLEFLGDSVLELAVASAIFAEHPEFEEGQLARLRSHIVSRQSCALVAEQLGLGRRLVELAGEADDSEVEELAHNRNVLGAVLEAALAALFLEHGFPAIAPAIVEAFRERIDYAATSHVDHKTVLQERLAQDGKQLAYGVMEVQGPPHARRFTVAALVDGERLGVGRGRSKKEAEQGAAAEALGRLGEPDDE